MQFPLFIAYIVSYFLHLTARFPALGAIRFDFILGGVLLLFILLEKKEDKWLLSVLTSRKLMIFGVYILLSLPLVTWPGSVLRVHLIEWVKSALIFVFLVNAVRSERQLKVTVFVFLGCQAFRILEPLYLHLTSGYWGDVAYSTFGGHLSGLDRLSGSPYDVVNPNQLAWVIVTTVPFMFYLWWKGGRSGKMLTLLSLPPFIYCMLLTGSRSGLLSLIFVFICMVLFSKRKIKNFFIAMIVVIPLAVYVFGGLGNGMDTRYLSIVDNNVVGSDTARDRVYALFKQAGSITHNPLFGSGLGTSPELNFNIVGADATPTHNLYLEILQETGIIGFVLFMLYIVAILKGLLEAKRALIVAGRSGSDWLFRLITATQAWVAMDLFYSLSCFGLSSWEWYFFGAISTVCYVFSKAMITSESELELPGSNSVIYGHTLPLARERNGE